jgi:hypothetical protein
MLSKRSAPFDAGRWHATCRRLVLAGLALAPTAAAALDLTAGSGAARECPALMPALHAEAIAYLEPAPLSAIEDPGDNRRTASRGNNAGVGVGFAELSSAAAGFCIGLVHREEAVGVATGDLIDIVQGERAGQRLDVGRDYQLHYAWHTLKASGLRIRRSFGIGEIRDVRFTLPLAASLLKPTAGTEETLDGSLTASTPDYGLGIATWWRTGSDLDPRTFNSFVGAGHPAGTGFSTDLQLRAQTPSGGTLDLIAMDLFGQIYWHDFRASMRILDNASIRYDENANREAFVTGFDARIRSEQRIPTKWRIALAQPVSNRFTLLLGDDALHGMHFVSVGARFGSSERFVATSFDTRTHAVGLGARWGLVAASLTTDRLRFQSANTLGFALDLARRW